MLYSCFDQILNCVVIECLSYQTEFIDRINGVEVVDVKEETVKEEDLSLPPSLTDLFELSEGVSSHRTSNNILTILRRPIDDSIATRPKKEAASVTPPRRATRKSQRRVSSR